MGKGFGNITSEGAYALRNDNTLQFHCLNNRMERLSNPEQTLCLQWRQCLEKDPEHFSTLQTFFNVALGPSNRGRRGKGSRNGKGRVQQTSAAAIRSLSQSSEGKFASICFNPAVDDIEALQCNCYQTAMTTCHNGE